jgi:site-specific recombinase XerD
VPGDNDDVLAGWWAYMRRRNWARGTRIKRLTEAHRYLEAVPQWRTASWRDIERYVDDRDVGPSTSRDIVSNLHAFYRWAGREGHCQGDPTALVDKPKVPRRLPRPAHADDIELALSIAPPRVAAMIALMAGCGLRCCEVAGLRWDDVDLARGEARVIGKGDRERTVWLGPAVVARLAELDTTSGPVFLNGHGRPASRSAVSQTVNQVFARAGLSARAHRLRHWHGTQALADCHRLEVVRDMLGHATTVTTEGYARLVPDAAAAVQRAIRLPGSAA